MSDGLVISGELDQLTNELGELQTTIYELEEELAPIDALWDDTFNDLLCTLLAAYEDGEKKGRVPGDTKCKALVIQEMREQKPLEFGEHRRKHNELDRLERKARRIEKRISSKQSNLSYLKTEAMAMR